MAENRKVVLVMTANSGNLTLDHNIKTNELILESVCIQNVTNGANNPLLGISIKNSSGYNIFSTSVHTSTDNENRIILFNDQEKKTTIYNPHHPVHSSTLMSRSVRYEIFNEIDNDRPTFGAGNEILSVTLVFSYKQIFTHSGA